jgi:hypothetical protein
MTSRSGRIQRLGLEALVALNAPPIVVLFHGLKPNLFGHLKLDRPLSLDRLTGNLGVKWPQFSWRWGGDGTSGNAIADFFSLQHGVHRLADRLWSGLPPCRTVLEFESER